MTKQRPAMAPAAHPRPANVAIIWVSIILLVCGVCVACKEDPRPPAPVIPANELMQGIQYHHDGCTYLRFGFDNSAQPAIHSATCRNPKHTKNCD